jgi:hypothetical protein
VGAMGAASMASRPSMGAGMGFLNGCGGRGSGLRAIARLVQAIYGSRLTHFKPKFGFRMDCSRHRSQNVSVSSGPFMSGR